MKGRCSNPNERFYRHYGGRGIKVCARYMESFEAFRDDMGPRPEGYTIDRKNNDGGYTCGQCEECKKNGWTANIRWATWKQQASNSRHNHILTFNGETKNMTQWSESTGIPMRTIWDRWNKGMPVDRILTPRKLSRYDT